MGLIEVIWNLKLVRNASISI